MADFNITVEQDRLSDGSKVFSVLIVDKRTLEEIKRPAVTSEDAYELSSKITRAINDHSTLTADEWS